MFSKFTSRYKKNLLTTSTPYPGNSNFEDADEGIESMTYEEWEQRGISLGERAALFIQKLIEFRKYVIGNLKNSCF